MKWVIDSHAVHEEFPDVPHGDQCCRGRGDHDDWILSSRFLWSTRGIDRLTLACCRGWSARRTVH